MTQVQLVNAALQRLGVDPIGNIRDNTKAAKAASLAWPLAVMATMRMNDWNSATVFRGGVNIADIAWKASTAYAAGAYVATATNLLRCTIAGISGAVEPVLTVGTLTDGTVTWENIDLLPSWNPDAFGVVILYPRDAAKVLAVGTSAYRVYGNYIFTNETSPTVKYVRIPDDINTVDGLLQEVVKCKLAEMLATSFGQNALSALLVQETELARRRALGSSSDERTEDKADTQYWTDKI